MKIDKELLYEVENAIKSDTLLNNVNINVSVKDRIITFFGIVESNAVKLEVERVVKTVSGVKAISEDIVVKVRAMWQKNDVEIATEIANLMRWKFDIPYDDVIVEVKNGWVTIEGELALQTQIEKVRTLIESVFGIKGVTNDITIKTKKQIKEDIIEDSNGKKAPIFPKF